MGFQFKIADIHLVFWLKQSECEKNGSVHSYFALSSHFGCRGGCLLEHGNLLFTWEKKPSLEKSCLYNVYNFLQNRHTLAVYRSNINFLFLSLLCYKAKNSTFLTSAFSILILISYNFKQS